jgi:hypothetical protein
MYLLLEYTLGYVLLDYILKFKMFYQYNYEVYAPGAGEVLLC